MATVATTTARRPSEQMDMNRSDGWPAEDTKRSPDDHDEVQFFQDGLNTGARILGKLCFGDIHSPCPNVDHVLS